jgi:hypothetical protein
VILTNDGKFIDILMAGSTKGRSPFIKTEIQRWKGEHAGIAADPDPEKHRAVRKILSPAFNPRALKEQEPILHVHMDAFIRKLEEGSAKGGVDVSEVISADQLPIAGAKQTDFLLFDSGSTGLPVILPEIYVTMANF